MKETGKVKPEGSKHNTNDKKNKRAGEQVAEKQVNKRFSHKSVECD